MSSFSPVQHLGLTACRDMIKDILKLPSATIMEYKSNNGWLFPLFNLHVTYMLSF